MVRKLSIHNRLALVLLGAALLAFLVAGAGLALFQGFTLEDRARQIMEPYAQLVAVGADAAVAFEDPQRATEILDTLRVNPQILQAAIYLDNQRPLASFTRTPDATPGVLPDKANGLYISDDTADMLRGLPHGARLHIRMGLNQLGEQTRQVLWLFAVGALVFLLATLGQLAVLRRTIVRPIASLTHAAELARAKADYRYRVPSEGSDEVARLGQSFNDMMEAIQQREDDLQRLTFFQRTILDNAAYGVISSSPEGFVTSFNPAAERLLGYTAEEVVNQQTPVLWHDPQELVRYATQLTDQLGEAVTPGFDVFAARPRRNQPEENEWTYIRKDGKRIQVNLSVTALRDERSRITGFVGLAYDLTERKQDELVMRRLNRELRAISDCNQVLVRAEDEQTLLENICRIVCEGADYRMAWVGYAEHDEARTVRPVARAGADMGYLEHTRFTWLDATHEPSGTAIRTGNIAGVDDFAADFQTQPWCEAALQRGYRSCIALPLKADDGSTFGLLGIYATEAHAFTTEEQRLLEELANDLAFGIVSLRTRSERTAAERRIEHLAFYDPLTELPNRRLLMDRLQRAFATSARTGLHGALLCLDLDHFKTLNDTLGHDMGDALLQQVAQRLNGCVRESDTVARLGGDEFLVLLEDLDALATDAAEQTQYVSEKILATLNQPYQLELHNVHSTTSVGAVLFAGQSQTVEEIVKHADLAMYAAKNSGRNAIRFFDPMMQAAISARAALENDLRTALDAGQFLLHYQIQVGHRVHPVGAEALIRWRHPERGLVSPSEFIPLAEETGLILPIGLWVLQTACTQLRRWQDNPVTERLQMSVNVSARQFRQPDFMEQIRTVLLQTGAPPDRLKLELTESLALDNVDDTIAKMTALRALGLRFSLDDFGTGQSSLSYLTRLPLDQLKIDQSFVRNIGIQHTDALIVQTIIGMAQSLGIDVIAEGVETDAQRAFLEMHGCTLCQGYLFSRPVPIEGLEQYLRARAASE
ncbi:MAG: EAL domain-containing protein [Comamonadaceae bacterium]|nr:MAG: EAL domain-containing protein [Comamonadaceae bacterium]